MPMPMPFYGNGFELSVFCVFNIPMCVRACESDCKSVLYERSFETQEECDSFEIEHYWLGKLLEFILQLSVTLGNASIRSAKIPFPDRSVILVM